MKYCMNCGAELGEGRFCTNCGTPVGSATPPVPVPVVEARPAPTTPVPAANDDRPHWTGWLLLALGIVLAVVLGSCLGRGSGDEASAAKPSGTTSSAPSSPAHSPSATGTAHDGERTDLAREASVEAPQPIRPGTDLAGNRVPYPATNMLDGRRDSAYRLAGDASGTVIRFSFTDDRSISAVGLVNGYAKVDAGTDWYPLNRRIETVEWTFADGTTLLQQLVDTPDLQTMQIAPETTSWVELRIVRATEPGGGRQGKDTTAISDVLLLGG